MARGGGAAVARRRTAEEAGGGGAAAGRRRGYVADCPPTVTSCHCLVMMSRPISVRSRID